MNQLEALSNFLIVATPDARIGPTHISLFVALLQLWHEQGYSNPFIVSRRLLMPISKINGLATYHEKLSDLHNFGYVVYCPNYNSYEGSTVKLQQFLLKQQAP